MSFRIFLYDKGSFAETLDRANLSLKRICLLMLYLCFLNDYLLPLVLPLFQLQSPSLQNKQKGKNRIIFELFYFNFSSFFYGILKLIAWAYLRTQGIQANVFELVCTMMTQFVSLYARWNKVTGCSIRSFIDENDFGLFFLQLSLSSTLIGIHIELHVTHLESS